MKPLYLLLIDLLNMSFKLDGVCSLQCEVHNGKVGEMPLGAVFNRVRKIEKSDC